MTAQPSIDKYTRNWKLVGGTLYGTDAFRIYGRQIVDIVIETLVIMNLFCGGSRVCSCQPETLSYSLYI